MGTAVTARYFLQQRDKLEKNEAPTDAMIASMNNFMRREEPALFSEFGIDTLNPDAHRDEPGKTPRVFVMKDGKPSTLTESGVKPGSREFWEAAMKGQLFGYQLGEKDPVQIQAWMGKTGLKCAISDPLTPDKEAKFPDEPEKPESSSDPVKPTKPKKPEEPRPVAEPGQEPPRPGFFTRLGALFGNRASMDRIAMHTAWTVQSAAYRKYQDDVKAYPGRLEEYESDLEYYAHQMQKYYASVVAKKVKDPGNVGKTETYELEHAAWEKENANKDQLSKARDQSAKAIADAFGKTRGDDVLASEKKEAKDQKKIYESTIDRLRVEQGVENMMSMYGSRPYARETFIKEGTYAAKDIEQLSQISLEGLRVGEGQPRPITDEDFAALSMFAVVTPENGRKLAAESSHPIVDYPGTVKAFEELGYTEQELGEVLANQFVGVVTTDTLRHDAPRNPMSTYFKSYVEPARLNARQALEEYQKGNKQPLADIISRGMEYTDQTARTSQDIDVCTSGLLRMASHMTDMMERDPQLKEMAAASFAQREQAMCARHKDFASPRTMDDLIQNVKAHEKIQEVRQRGAEAQEKLLNAQTGRAALSDQEKKECLRDVMKCDLANGMYKTRTAKLAKDALGVMEPVSNQVEKYRTHETLAMLPTTINVILQTRYVQRSTEKTPSALDLFNDPKAMKSMDRKLDALIEQEIHKKGGSLDLMCDKVLDKNDVTYSGKSLAESIQKQAAPEPAKEQANKTLQQDQPKLQQEQPTKGQGGPTVV